jgi:hypothetical protein
VNINQITQQDIDSAPRATPDCAPVAATIVLGPSTMQDGGARILGTFAPCVLNGGTALLNLPDEPGIKLVAANIQGGQTTQSVVVPLNKIAPITQGQVLFGANLNERISGEDPATGNPVTMNGNINALFLLNDSGEDVELGGDHSAAYNAILRR